MGLIEGLEPGSWVHVAKAKVAFVFLRMPLINSITSPFLQRIVLRMVDLFSTRQMALLSRTLYLVEMKADAEIQRYTGPQPVWWLPQAARLVPSPKNDIFAEFARAWGIIGIT